MRTSIIGTFFLASPVEVREGKRWYSDAAKIAESISDETGISHLKVAGVIAALSPQNPWDRNVTDARNICQVYSIDGKDAAQAVKVGTFGANKAKAIKILQCEGLVDYVTVCHILNGQKVVNFYRSILGHDDAVCVDGHAYSIWLGERVSTKDTPKLTTNLYNRIAEDYRECTTKINEILGSNYKPSTVQAITWVVHRNLYAGQRRKRSKSA